MLGRFVIIGVTVAALGAPAAIAGPFHQAWQLKQFCKSLPAQVKQCAFQFVTGDRNKATTTQTTEQFGNSSSTQFSYTYQNGDDNTAYTEQNGTDQFSKTIQVGDGNFAGTSLEGENQKSTIVENGDGIWGTIGSTTDGSVTTVIVNP